MNCGPIRNDWSSPRAIVVAGAEEESPASMQARSVSSTAWYGVEQSEGEIVHRVFSHS
jgi:hypothetical protein